MRILYILSTAVDFSQKVSCLSNYILTGNIYTHKYLTIYLLTGCIYIVKNFLSHNSQYGCYGNVLVVSYLKPICPEENPGSRFYCAEFAFSAVCIICAYTYLFDFFFSLSKGFYLFFLLC